MGRTLSKRVIPVLLLVLMAAGCAAAGTGTRRSANLITAAEIQDRGPYRNLYDLVANLRPRWLRTQGPDTFQAGQGQVQVHMDGNRMGDVSILKTLSASGVTSLQWLPPIDASARYGLDHGQGAIIVSTAPAP
jgi:hypothetical protein